MNTNARVARSPALVAAIWNCPARTLDPALGFLWVMPGPIPAIQVTRHIQPLVDLFQDAIALGHRREKQIPERFWTCLDRHSTHKDCERIYRRLEKHFDELFTFLEHPGIPSDNNPGERDIRSLAATRADGGVNRKGWSATAFGRIKSVVRTCQKMVVAFWTTESS